MISEAHHYAFTLTIALAGLLIHSTASLAQTPHSVDPFAAAAAPFDQLDPQAMATGLLAERSNPFFPIYRYTLGLPFHDTLTVNADNLQMAAVTAATMAYDVADAAWLGEDWFKQRRRTNSDTAYFGALLVHHDQLAADAETRNLVSVDVSRGKVLDVPGRLASPYIQSVASLAAPLTQKLTSKRVMLYFNSKDLLSNISGARLRAIHIAGKRYGIRSDRGYPFGFANGGTYPVTLEFSSVLGVHKAHISLIVPEPQAPVASKGPGDSTVLQIPGGGGTLRIYYNLESSRQLRKPILFVGGLDPLNQRGYHDVTRPKLRYLVRQTGTEYDGRQVLRQLEDDNYDIVFLDWEEGAASLGTNGAVVARAIQLLNRQKDQSGDCSESIVVGQSMGGLCVRTGLHMLDSMGVDPRMKAFFSWDSPHQGANYPVNLQSMTVWLGSRVISHYGVTLKDVVG